MITPSPSFRLPPRPFECGNHADPLAAGKSKQRCTRRSLRSTSRSRPAALGRVAASPLLPGCSSRETAQRVGALLRVLPALVVRKWRRASVMSKLTFITRCLRVKEEQRPLPAKSRPSSLHLMLISSAAIISLRLLWPSAPLRSDLGLPFRRTEGEGEPKSTETNAATREDDEDTQRNTAAAVC